MSTNDPKPALYGRGLLASRASKDPNRPPLAGGCFNVTYAYLYSGDLVRDVLNITFMGTAAYATILNGIGWVAGRKMDELRQSAPSL